MNEQDQVHMRHALSLAARGLGRVWPNPSVGCVIVRDGRVVGRGRTADRGRPHAETQALLQAGEHSRGATAYVTLEPCAHQGKTPPCANALIEAGISRVVAASKDPDPRVSGAGFAMLQGAGIDLVTDCLSAEADELQIGFLNRVTLGRPMLTLKLALSVDGRIATASGQSQWITGPEARRQVHAMRANHDAVLIGAGTAREDNPDLRVRALGINHQPIRIVASRHLRLPVDSKLFRSASDSPVWLAADTSSLDQDVLREWRRAGAKILAVPSEDGQLSASGLMAALGEAGLTRVFCEGGGMLAASLLRTNLVDNLVGFFAGKVIGAEGQPGVGPLGVSELSAAPQFELAESRRLGNDVMHRWVRR